MCRTTHSHYPFPAGGEGGSYGLPARGVVCSTQVEEAASGSRSTRPGPRGPPRDEGQQDTPRGICPVVRIVDIEVLLTEAYNEDHKYERRSFTPLPRLLPCVEKTHRVLGHW